MDVDSVSVNILFENEEDGGEREGEGGIEEREVRKGADRIVASAFFPGHQDPATRLEDKQMICVWVTIVSYRYGKDWRFRVGGIAIVLVYYYELN